MTASIDTVNTNATTQGITGATLPGAVAFRADTAFPIPANGLAVVRATYLCRVKQLKSAAGFIIAVIGLAFSLFVSTSQDVANGVDESDGYSHYRYCDVSQKQASGPYALPWSLSRLSRPLPHPHHLPRSQSRRVLPWSHSSDGSSPSYDVQHHSGYLSATSIPTARTATEWVAPSVEPVLGGERGIG
jgi:hypothetical protein